jgi:hypothetical protein
MEIEVQVQTSQRVSQTLISPNKKKKKKAG